MSASESRRGARRPTFQSGGTLLDDAFYLRRSADEEVFEALRKSDYCIVFAPRQIGKSSLRKKVQERLEADGVRCALVDITGIQTDPTTPEQWHLDVAVEVARELGIDEDLPRFWDALPSSAVVRWTRFLEEYVLARVAEPVVIFLDELDSMLKIKAFRPDDFMASIRFLYNKRADIAGLRRLTFCLLGVVLPSDLIEDPERTPFNVGTSVRLADFSRAEMNPLKDGLTDAAADPGRLLDEVYAWTSGHPYMTQKICGALVKKGSGAAGIPAGSERERVDALTKELFLRGGPTSDRNLEYAQIRFESRRHAPEMLQLYKRMLRGDKVAVNRGTLIQEELCLTGMAMERRENDVERLRVRNRIFASVFGEEWVREKEEKRRLLAPIEAWLAAQKSPQALPQGTPLEELLAWAKERHDLTEQENAFLREAVAEDGRRQAARARLRTILAVAASLLALVIAVAAAVVVGAARAEAQATKAKADYEARLKMQAELDALEEKAKKAAEEARQAIEETTRVKDEAKRATEEAKQEEARARDEATRAAVETRSAIDEAKRARDEEKQARGEAAQALRARSAAEAEREKLQSEQSTLIARIEQLKNQKTILETKCPAIGGPVKDINLPPPAQPSNDPRMRP